MLMRLRDLGGGVGVSEGGIVESTICVLLLLSLSCSPPRAAHTTIRTLLTLKPLPKINPKDKGKKMIEEEDESDTDSEDITKAEKKFKQLARDEEVARKVQEVWKAKEEVKKLAEREMYTIEQRAKFIHDTIAAQRRFLAQQRSEAIRNKPPSRNQLRNQMMTYLKHVGGKKHSDLKTKGFEEIKALYDKIKRYDDSFIAIGFAKDKKMSWKLHSSSGIHIIMTGEGIVIYMLVENKYPLKKEVLSQLLKLKLETEEDSTMALELIRFVKK
ncbi:hypothetical protein Tco_0406929 [Tanacetum coccineum]